MIIGPMGTAVLGAILGLGCIAQTKGSLIQSVAIIPLAPQNLRSAPRDISIAQQTLRKAYLKYLPAHNKNAILSYLFFTRTQKWIFENNFKSSGGSFQTSTIASWCLPLMKASMANLRLRSGRFRTRGCTFIRCRKMSLMRHLDMQRLMRKKKLRPILMSQRRLMMTVHSNTLCHLTGLSTQYTALATKKAPSP